MGLTENVRLRLESKGFAKLYKDFANDWKALAEECRSLIKPKVANGQPTVDDIQLIMEPLMELDKHFRAFMEKNPRLTQRYWVRDFTEYVLHNVYNPKLTVEED